MKDKYVVVLSDIHMGTNSPTVWYCKEIHEKYLLAILNDIINCADQIEEVILLGDIFEFWAYPPDALPPTINDIIEANPNVLGPYGKLVQALSALKGRMTYISGDHDMNVTQAELNKIRSNDGYTIKFHYGAYFPYYDSGIKFIHGHEFTILNAPYFASRIAPIPIGHFVCRAFAYKVQSILKKTQEESICMLEDYSACNYNDFLPLLPFYYEHFSKDTNVISNFVDALIDATGIPGDMPILVNPFYSATLYDVKTIYQSQELVSEKLELKDIIDDFNKKNFSEKIMNHCVEREVDTVVMGHTHSPSIFKNDEIMYVTTGCMCPSVSKMQTNPITYGLYNLSERKFELIKAIGESRVTIIPYEKKNEDDNQAACNIKTEETSKYPSKIFTFGWSVFDTSQEFWEEMQMGVLNKAKELGINIIVHDEKRNTIEMITGSIDLISQGIDALIIAPFNPELLPVITANAEKYNIPVVAIDTGTGGANVVAFIVSDNFGGGILAGEYALNLIKSHRIESKNFAIIKVQKTAKYSLLRGEGFKSVLLAQGFYLVTEVTANSEESEAYVEMQKILISYGNDLAVVFCENGTMAIGASRAINEAGKKNIIMLIGFDAGPRVIDAIKAGDLQGTIAQQPYRMGQIGVEIANTYLLGNPITFDDWREKIILMEVFLVDETGTVQNNVT